MQELSRVEWLIAESARWDVTLVGRADARRLVQFYSQQAQWLRSELVGVERTQPVLAEPLSVEPLPVTSLTPGAEVKPPQAEGVAPRIEAAPTPMVEPAPEVPAEPAPPPSAHPLEATEPPTPETRVVEAASAWSRVWKPFLTDSVGWFVGGFLILAGTFWFVADAWAGMTSTVRAVTVFGLAAGWTLAFAAWARFLFRREATTPAARMLERLAAAMAPLATVAMGPAQDSPLLFWPLVLGWSGVTAWLMRLPARRVDEAGATPLALASGLTALVMGTAPLVASVGVHATWLVALPVALAAWAFSAGPREAPDAERFLLAAFGWVLVLFSARLEVALLHVGAPLTLTLLAPMLAAAVASARWLAKPPTKAADALSVLVVMVQVAMLGLAIDVFTPRPAFVVTALLGAWTAWSLAKERVSLASARWLPVAYVFAYLAYQRIDQVVPQEVRDWYVQLKSSLGYSTAPLPASYGSVYAALFIVVVGVVALLRSRRRDAMSAHEGHVLLDTTAVASGLSSLLAVASLGEDARPALLATPLLGLVTLGLALASGRFLLTLFGVVGVLCAAAALAVGLASPAWWGLVALGLAVASVPALKPHRQVLSTGAVLLAAIGLTVALLAEPSLAATLTAGLSAAAVLLVARNVDEAEWLELAWVGPVLAIVVGSRWLAVGLEPVVLASAAVVAGVLMQRDGRWKTLRTMTTVAAVSAVAWHFLVLAPVTWPGVTMLLAAVAVGLVSRVSQGLARSTLEAVATVLAVGTLVREGCFPWPSPLEPQLLAGALVTFASVMSVLQGRRFRWSWLASVALFVALLDTVDVTPVRLPIAVVISLLATPALVPVVTLPLAGVLASLFVVTGFPPQAQGTAFSIVALAMALLGLLERVPAARRIAFNESPGAWPAVASSGVLLLPAMGLDPQVLWAPLALGVVVPQLWSLSASRRWLATLSVPLAAWGAGWGVWASAQALLVAPPLVALAVAFTWRPRGSAPRDLVFDRVMLVVITLASCGSVMFSTAEHVAPIWMLPWALALLVVPVGALAVRLGLSAAVLTMLSTGTLSASPLALPFVGVLLLVGFALRHAPQVTARVLGARSVEWAVWSAAASAVGLAGVVLLREPSAVAQGVLVASLLASALLTGALPLLTAGLVLAGVQLPRLVESGELALWPLAPALALGIVVGAAALRHASLEARAEAFLTTVGSGGRHLASWVWLSGAFLVVLALPEQRLGWALPALGLLVTPRVSEAAAAALLTSLVVAVALPLPVAGALIATLGAGLAWAGALRPDEEPAAGWLHSGWVLAVVSLVLSADLHAWGMPVSWVLAATTAWAVQRRFPKTRWVAWSAVWAASHAVLAWAGITLSTGAPKELILPWFALASMLVAIVPATRPWVAQHVPLGLTFRVLGLVELALGALVCPGGHEREALAVVAAVAVSVWLALRDAKDDEPTGVWLGAWTVTAGFVLARVLWGAELGLPESVAALGVGFVASVLSGRVAEELPDVATALRRIAMGWPLLGLLGAPWASPTQLSVLLVAMAAHYVVVAQVGGRKGVAPVLAAVAFNAAVVVQWVGLGWSEPQYLLVPAGLSGLVLVHVFADELGAAWAARLRALAIGVVYAAAAFRPLAIDAPWAFFLCVALCVAGVGAGVAMRVRSFVTLGSVFLVTTVVATLVRWGVREPRLGALFLSGLGLAVVAFMVVVTTKKAELLERYKRVRGALERWEG